MHTAEKKLLMLRPSEIYIPSGRAREDDDEYELKLLADSISFIGIIEPIAVRKNKNGMYELVSGERRLKAAILAGLRRVPCVFHRIEESEAAVFSLIGNIQHKDLHYLDEAILFERLTSEHGISVEQVCARLGISQAKLCNRIRLLRLSHGLQRQIKKLDVSERHALLLLRVREDMREELLDRIIDESLTVAQTERYISELLCPSETLGSIETDTDEAPEKCEEEHKEPLRRAMIGDVRLFENSLDKLVDTLRGIGIEANTHRRETDKYTEYRVRIKKDAAAASYKQLKIC